MASLRNSIVALEREKIPIFKDTIVKVLEEYMTLELDPKDILNNCEQVCDSAKLLIEKEINAQRPIDIQKLINDIQNEDFN
jgi:hypothetical protein